MHILMSCWIILISDLLHLGIIWVRFYILCVCGGVCVRWRVPYPILSLLCQLLLYIIQSYTRIASFMCLTTTAQGSSLWIQDLTGTALVLCISRWDVFYCGVVKKLALYSNWLSAQLSHGKTTATCRNCMTTCALCSAVTFQLGTTQCHRNLGIHLWNQPQILTRRCIYVN